MRNRNDSGEYRLIAREDEGDGAWEACSRCGYPAPLADLPPLPCPPDWTKRDPVLLCELCANTHEPHDADGKRITRTVCHVGNAILAVLYEVVERLVPEGPP